MTQYKTGVPSARGLGAQAVPDAQMGSLLLREGHVVDPANGVDEICDLALKDGRVTARGQRLFADPHCRILDCRGLLVLPGLIDLHLHLGDLFDINDSPVKQAVCDGVTLGLSPGAGNTYMAPSLLGAEVDRGIALNAGVFLGAAAVLCTRLSTAEIVALFRGELPCEIAAQKLSRNAIVNATAQYAIGLKDHMGHFILPDEQVERLFEIAQGAGLLLMSHTQDPAHTRRMVNLSKGRGLHLGHATAAGCGTHADALAGFSEVLSLVDGENITAEFVTSMLLPCKGRRDGLLMDERARQMALQALADGQVKILVSDGQSGATMKGFGCTADNLPCIFSLVDAGVLSLSQAVATMTANPAALLARRTENAFFRTETGCLSLGALGNVTVVEPSSARAVYTIVNGAVAAFDGHLVAKGAANGGLCHRGGLLRRTGVGDLALYQSGRSEGGNA